MSRIEDVARGLLVDAFITYAAVCREKGYNGEEATQSARARALFAWNSQLSEMREGIESHMGIPDSYPEHVETLIEERRGLIRDTMREEMADLEAASPPSEDAEGIRDERQG